MKTIQFEQLIQHVTKRPLSLEKHEEIPLESEISVCRPHKENKKIVAFTWKTPKKEDSILRSFITAFCS